MTAPFSNTDTAPQRGEGKKFPAAKVFRPPATNTIPFVKTGAAKNHFTFKSPAFSKTLVNIGF